MRSLALVLALLCLLAPWSATPARDVDESTKAFFNGKDLEDFEGLMQFWSVKDGAIVGLTEKDPGFNTFLCSKKKYKDFELSFQVRLKDGQGNSGGQIRSETFDKEHYSVKCPQCAIGRIFWGSLY